MDYIRFLVKISNVVGYILIATIVLSPIGFIEVLLGYLVLLEIDRSNGDTIFKKAVSKLI